MPRNFIIIIFTTTITTIIVFVIAIIVPILVTMFIFIAARHNLNSKKKFNGPVYLYKFIYKKFYIKN